MTTPDDPLLERLGRLPRPRLDDVTGARTLARAEAAFASAAGGAAVVRRPLWRWPVPAALALWGLLYCWGAVREIGRLYPADGAAKPAVAANHRGPTGVVAGDAQFMLNAISKASASMTATTTTMPPRPDALRVTGTFVSISVPVRSEMSSEDMDPSMRVQTWIVGETPECRTSEPTRRAGRGTIAGRTAARWARTLLRTNGGTPTRQTSR